jgi:hypothetical protein
MRQQDIRIGGVYTAKITDKVVPVRIDAENPHGGWDGTNLETKKRVRIKSPRKLRREVPTEGDRNATSATSAKDASKPTTKAKAPGAATRATTAAPGTKKPREARDKATGSKKPTRGKPAAPGRTGVLDAAVQILAKAKEPMSCKAIVEQAIKEGLWSTGGKTPHATLYSAVIREIARKGKDARFEKVDRGRFQLRKGA